MPIPIRRGCIYIFKKIKLFQHTYVGLELKMLFSIWIKLWSKNWEMRKNENYKFKVGVASEFHARYAIANFRNSPRTLFSLDSLSPLIYFQTFYFSSEQFRPSTCKHRRASVGESEKKKKKNRKKKNLKYHKFTREADYRRDLCLHRSSSRAIECKWWCLKW